LTVAYNATKEEKVEVLKRWQEGVQKRLGEKNGTGIP
jgi:hypothetical protein